MTTTVPTAPPHLTARRRWAVLLTCSLSLFLVGLDTTIVNVGLPAIGRGLGVGTHALSWVVDAYTIVLAGLLITSGALADRFGRRRVFRCGLVVFGAASVACAVAPSVQVLVAARAVQGVGASMLSPVALAIVVSAMTDPRERARAIGVWASVFGLSMAAGPVTGGLLVDAFGWRAMFWVNVPAVAVVLALTALVVPESRAERPRRPDLVGQVLVIAALAGIVGVLIEGPRLGWSSPVATVGCTLTIGAVAGFVLAERRHPQPLIDPALFRHLAFTMAVVGAVAVFVALNVVLLLTTVNLQQGRGWTALEAGSTLLPMALGATVLAPVSGILVGRSGPRLPLSLAGLFVSAGGLALAGTDADTSPPMLLVCFLLLGVGIGFANAPITTIAVSSLPAARSGVAGGITSTARQVGAALGIALAGGLVTGVGAADLAHASRPGWFLVTSCGLFLLLVALASHSMRPRARD